MRIFGVAPTEKAAPIDNSAIDATSFNSSSLDASEDVIKLDDIQNAGQHESDEELTEESR